MNDDASKTRDYMIAHYPKFNEWAILRANEDEVQWLNSNEQWTTEKRWAKRFYHKWTVEWALVLCRIKWLKEEEIYRPKEIKQSWGEL